MRYLERIIPLLADTVIVVNQKIKKFCVDMGVPEQKLEVVPNGVDSELFKPEIRDERLRDHLSLKDNRVVFFRGKMNRYYRIDVILKAVPMVLTKFPKTKFLFVGDGDNLDNLKVLSKHLKIENSVVFTGFMLHDELPKYINLSDVCLYSLPNSSALALLEYAACAKPTILPHGGTKKIGISHEIIQQNCALLVEHSPEGFAQGINFLLSNEEKAKEMGKKAMKLTVELYGWDKLAKNYEKALRKVFY